MRLVYSAQVLAAPVICSRGVYQGLAESVESRETSIYSTIDGLDVLPSLACEGSNVLTLV